VGTRLSSTDNRYSNLLAQLASPTARESLSCCSCPMTRSSILVQASTTP
jgi:hypothetical protein